VKNDFKNESECSKNDNQKENLPLRKLK